MEESKIKDKHYNEYETIIIGGGPAGLTAGIYLSRARVSALLLEKGLPGGQANLTEMIENYPGFPDGIIGPELMQQFVSQASRFGLKIENNDVLEISSTDQHGKNLFQVKTELTQFYAESIIIASGAQASKLGIPGEKEYTGRGVSYCGTCDGAFFREKDIIVVGGGDTAIEESLFLTKFARKVYIVHRRDKLRATKILQERAFANDKIEIIWDSIVLEIKGNNKVEKVLLKNVKKNQERDFSCQGVFIFTGYTPSYPSLGSFHGKLVNDKGYITTDEDMKTKVDGIYACGDVRAKKLRQVVTACGEGAIAAFSVEKYLEYLKN
ncbi:MAG: thioredoxin-disulfide reductase [Atribacterota bacterium]|nr:thioredoxin-disulfide reductase [Atribacterota bacterium]